MGARSGLPLANSGIGGPMRAIRFHCAHRPTAHWLLGAFAALMSLTACRPGTPVVDLAPKPVQADGTISGIARGPEGTSPVDGRAVAVINTVTGERQSTTTSNTG